MDHAQGEMLIDILWESITTRELSSLVNVVSFAFDQSTRCVGQNSLRYTARLYSKSQYTDQYQHSVNDFETTCEVCAVG